CDCDAACTASTAIFTLPSVPFLKPIGHDRPEASSRCTWLSVVRAPIAPHATRSAMYCGVIMSRNSQPAGTPSALMSHNRPRARRRPLSIRKLPSRSGSLIRPFQPTVVRGFSKYTRITISSASPSSRRSSASLPAYSSAAGVSWMEHGPITTTSRSSRPLMMACSAWREASTVAIAAAVAVQSRMTSAGVLRGVIALMRRSSVACMAAVLVVSGWRPTKNRQGCWRFGVMVSISSCRSRARRRRWLRIAVKPEIQAGGDGVHGAIVTTMDVQIKPDVIRAINWTHAFAFRTVDPPRPRTPAPLGAERVPARRCRQPRLRPPVGRPGPVRPAQRHLAGAFRLPRHAGRRMGSLQLPWRPAGPAAPNDSLRRRHHLRATHPGRGIDCTRAADPWPHRRARRGWPAVLGQRPPSADLGARERGVLFPAGLSPLQPHRLAAGCRRPLLRRGAADRRVARCTRRASLRTRSFRLLPPDPGRTGLYRALAGGTRPAGASAPAGAGSRPVARSVPARRQRPAAGLGRRDAGTHAAAAAPGGIRCPRIVVDRAGIPRRIEGRHRQPRLPAHGYPAGATATLDIALPDRH